LPEWPPRSIVAHQPGDARWISSGLKGIEQPPAGNNSTWKHLDDKGP
jgi:hypothetical protein